MIGWRAFLHLLWRDVRIEVRRPQFFAASASFGVLLVFVTGIALDAAEHLPADWVSGVLWLDIFYAATVGVHRHDFKDIEWGGGEGVLLAPVDRSVIFYARWVSVSLFIAASGLVMAAAWFLLLNPPPPAQPGLFAFALGAGALGLGGVTTFVAALTAHTRLRDVLTPLLLFPLAIPLFIGVVRLTAYALEPTLGHPRVWVEEVLGYIAAMLVVPWLVYEWVMEG
ncbi:heme exporter protein CcmB [Alicyclobacillus macrosporangiidus]|uniref:heme exporter protein CcmB n=1 Tax=Alicyclobacillus macrosporangiidus TaxID=392015 RepID=UPI00068B93E4|nr:heme exporter protein CcmB [Alicyclobacillus macrosporangiidus]MCL6600131.1 heme exporter protein CcmB [Alicyclobacillus macrosporangiidus]